MLIWKCRIDCKTCDRIITQDGISSTKGYYWFLMFLSSILFVCYFFFPLLSLLFVFIVCVIYFPFSMLLFVLIILPLLVFKCFVDFFVYYVYCLFFILFLYILFIFPIPLVFFVYCGCFPCSIRPFLDAVCIFSFPSVLLVYIVSIFPFFLLY